MVSASVVRSMPFTNYKLGSIFHGQPPSIASARCNRRECVDANVQRIRKEIGQRSGQRSGPVDTVVGQQEHRIGLHRLPCERPETSRDPINFILPWQGIATMVGRLD